MRRLKTLYPRLVGALGHSSPDLPAQRRLAELQKQIPTMYGMLCVNCVALAATHLDLAPIPVTVAFPAAVILVCLTRAVRWMKMEPERFTEEQAISQLRKTTVIAGVLSVAFIVWAMVMRHYGGPQEQGQVSVFLTLTIIATILCLNHLLIASYIIIVCVLSVLMITFIASGKAVY